MQTIKKSLSLLTVKEKRRLVFILMIMILMALLETIGVASILPFMAVLTNPSLIETNILLKNMYQTSKMFGVENNQQFLFALGILVFLLLIISLTFKAITIYIQILFMHMCEHSISQKLVERYLHQPYSWFLSRNSADLGKTILSETQQLINYGLNSLMEIFAKGMVAISILALIILTNPKLASIVGLIVIGFYGLIFYFLRLYIDRIGRKRLFNNQLRFTLVSEVFRTIKEIKLANLEKLYVKLFSNASEIFARTQAHSKIFSQLPRFILEAIAFGGILLIILTIIFQTGSFNSAIPIISLYVFAGYRLIPAIQQTYASFINLRFSNPAIEKLYDDLKNLEIINVIQDQELLPLNKEINLKKISYNYPNNSRTVLKNINLKISAKTSVGFVGTTGSGKTTLADIILGLLKPQSGSIDVDGKIITERNLRYWQKSIGYVPQDIHLLDDSIKNNIAFGVEKTLINEDAVIKAAKIANLHDFVSNELQQKYQTIIGENGIRLSGGQRQRIAIARALYHSPKVLIFDEATSALDNETENSVMESLNKLNKDITIIIIAHRLSTVKNCDKIFLLENGELKREGTFDNLISIKENYSIN